MGTKDYDSDLLMIKKALSQMETLTGNYNCYAVSGPSSKFGWTFFKLSLRPELEDAIRAEFSDMISRYSWSNQNEKFTRFMEDYFKAKGSQISLKKID